MSRTSPRTITGISAWNSRSIAFVRSPSTYAACCARRWSSTESCRSSSPAAWTASSASRSSLSYPELGRTSASNARPASFRMPMRARASVTRSSTACARSAARRYAGCATSSFAKPPEASAIISSSRASRGGQPIAFASLRIWSKLAIMPPVWSSVPYAFARNARTLSRRASFGSGGREIGLFAHGSAHRSARGSRGHRRTAPCSAAAGRCRARARRVARDSTRARPRRRPCRCGTLAHTSDPVRAIRIDTLREIREVGMLRDHVGALRGCPRGAECLLGVAGLGLRTVAVQRERTGDAGDDDERRDHGQPARPSAARALERREQRGHVFPAVRRIWREPAREHCTHTGRQPGIALRRTGAGGRAELLDRRAVVRPRSGQRFPRATQKPN